MPLNDRQLSELMDIRNGYEIGQELSPQAV